MNKGYSWDLVRYATEGDPSVPFDRVLKRRIVPRAGERTGYECCDCGRVFKRKHVRWMGSGWICRDRCERQNRSAS